MSSASERLRRILSDHGAAVRRASEIPAPARAAASTAPATPSSPAPTSSPAGPISPSAPASPIHDPLLDARAPLDAGPPAAARPTGDAATARSGDALRARLEALRAQAVGRGPRGPASAPGTAPEAPLVLPDDDDERPLEVRVGGRLRSGPKGSFLEVERRWPLAQRHGHAPLADALERAIPLRRRERRPGGATHVHPRDAVFLDVETTGLAGGTGTVAFLVGIARVAGDDLLVRQYFLRDFPDEEAVLLALADDLGDAPLVTFNGRTFDAPLLATRFRLHRVPFADRDHLDLLPPARRLWSASLASHALSALERDVLGVTRTHDLPGALVPAAYFAWLREARTAAVSLAFRHNEVDLVSLVALAGVVSRLVDDPTSRRDAPPRDHLDTARLLLDQGDAGRARACLEAVVAGGGDVPASVRRLLGAIQRRQGDLDGAIATWSAAMEADGPFDAHPYEEVAKVLEHRAKDLRAALAVVERALGRCPTDAAHLDALRHRARRLRERIARTANGGRSRGPRGDRHGPRAPA